jgi:uncharacterized protein YjbI with pentapeptide repeats
MQFHETNTPFALSAARTLYWLRQSNQALVSGMIADLGGGPEANTRAAEIVGVLQRRGLPVDTANLRQSVALLRVPDQLRELQVAAQTPNSGLTAKVSALRELASNFTGLKPLVSAAAQDPLTLGSSRLPVNEMRRNFDRLQPKTPPARPLAGEPITDISAFLVKESDGRAKLSLEGQDLRAVPNLAQQLRDLRDAEPNLIIDMSHSNLSNVSLAGSNLLGARLIGANLTGANLREVDLHAASLTGANLRGAILIKARLTANFDRANLSNAVLNEANLMNAGMEGANLSGASLRGAELSTAHFQGANLSNANLTGAYMNHAQLQGADLRSASMNDTSLFSADFSQARLSGVQLERANLTQAKFEGADLTRANMHQATMTKADFTNAVLTNAQVKGAATRDIILNGSVQDGVVW